MTQLRPLLAAITPTTPKRFAPRASTDRITLGPSSRPTSGIAVETFHEYKIRYPCELLIEGPTRGGQDHP